MCETWSLADRDEREMTEKGAEEVFGMKGN